MPLRTANIIGSGPNGLAAGITLAQAGVAVAIYERSCTLGGGVSTAELTLPGFNHDVASSVYPLAVASPFFRTLPLNDFGLRYIHPDAPLAHPFDDGSALTLENDVEDTIAQLGRDDGNAWRKLFKPMIEDWPNLVRAVTHPLRGGPHHPLGLARFGMSGLLPAATLAQRKFSNEHTRALLAGNAAHSVLPLTHIGSSAAGLVLAVAAHTTGWPIAAGGSQSLANALAGYFRSLGGQIWLNAEIASLGDLDAAASAQDHVTLFDTGPRAVDRIAGTFLTNSFRTRMRHFHYGPGAFKIDWALSEPIPWKAAACKRAATVHLGGSLAEIADSEAAACKNRHQDQRAAKPFVLLAQPSLFDSTRAPLGRSGRPQHTAWGYCHTNSGSERDFTRAIEAQVERFAPGFRDCIIGRFSRNAAQLETWNPNLVGGDISGGSLTLTQLLLRPTSYLYRTSNPGIYLCSASTPPGGGVHGMCGHLAARAALSDHR